MSKLTMKLSERIRLGAIADVLSKEYMDDLIDEVAQLEAENERLRESIDLLWQCPKCGYVLNDALKEGG